ncbi:MAG: purple acid phosphatase family protein [Myxococcota bacterium]
MRLCLLLCLTLAGGARAATLTRGPFLQLPEPRAITVVFLTDVPSVGAVRFGPAGGALTGMVSDLAPTTEHVLRLGGLEPSTRYSYEVSLDGVLAAGGDDFRFRTSPLPGTAAPFRFFAWGDSGLGNVAQLSVAERLAAQAGDATFFLILGDIIYYFGQPELYDARYFTPYAPLLRHLVGWPTIGNHDVGLDPLGGPYLDAFHLPTNNPAQSELYYSFDYGDAHFVCLDTHVNSLAAGSPQLTWAQADLAASSARWKLVYFHVPPYSGGTHADNPAIRDTVLPVLEAAGVDVVFSGHSHVYERTYLLSASTIVQGDPSTYSKVADGGTLYVVTGTAGQSGGLSNPAHPLMAYQAGGVLGASVVDVDRDTLRGYFLQADGTAVDLFQLSKGDDVSPPRLLGVSVRSERELEVAFDEPLSNAEELERWAAGARVLAVRVASDRRTVTLETERHTPGSWELVATGLADTSPARNQVIARAPYVVRQPVPLTPDALRWVASEQAPVGVDWTSPGFDDASWNAGSFPLGFGNSVATPTPNAPSLFARVRFRPPVAPRLLQELTLALDYDDGVVVWLNGVEVHRQNVPLGQEPSTLATGVREPGFIQRLHLPAPARELLRDGENVLALEVHDATGGAGDGYLSARLIAALEPPRSIDAGALPDASVPVADGGVRDAGASGGVLDGGGAPDAGPAAIRFGGSGCTCSALDVSPLVVLGLASWRQRRSARASTSRSAHRYSAGR